MRYRLYKIKIFIIRTLILILFILFVWSFLFFINAAIEKSVVNNELETFKSRGELDKTIVIQGQNVDIYKVKQKYSYEDASTFVFDDSLTSNYYIGSMTDIILTTRNPLRMYSTAIVRDVSEFVANLSFAGHGTINITSDGSYVMESVGNEIENNGVRITEQNWIYAEVRYGNDAQIIVGLRLKYIDIEKKNKICERLLELEGKEYNYLLPFYSKDKYYCTDLISRVLKKENIDVNYDGFYTTGNDIIISNSTYPIFLCERIEDGYFKIYYLCEE